MADYGRYGDSSSAADEKIRDKNAVLEVTIDECMTLLAKPKGGRRTAEVLKELGEDPKTNKALRLMDGRYGPYVTDGTTNASLGKDLEPDGLTLEVAIDLIGPREGAERSASRARRRSPERSVKSSPHSRSIMRRASPPPNRHALEGHGHDSADIGGIERSHPVLIERLLNAGEYLVDALEDASSR